MTDDGHRVSISQHSQTPENPFKKIVGNFIEVEIL